MSKDLNQSTQDHPRYLQTKIARLLTVLKEKGALYVAVYLFNHLFARFISRFYRTFVKRKFIFDGIDFPYFFHPHNHTWLNERVIEVPIVYRIVQDCQTRNGRILEVGNVLSHYFPINHEVVDKYEISEGVINQDIVVFTTPYRYDLIVSISTLEHVGWDELPRQPEKIFKAIERLKSLLTKNGKLYVTLPVGENPYLDEILREGRLTFDHQYNFVRVGKAEWKQTDWQNISFAQHNKPFRFGNAVIIGCIEA